LPALVLFWPARAWAIIPHKYIGFYPHQLGHLFFLVAMAVLILSMRRMGLLKEKGWRYIAWSAGFLLFWNVHTFLGHFVELSVKPDVFIDRESFFGGLIRLNFTTFNYYVYRLEHVIMISAMLFLYLGIREHLKGLADRR